MPDVIGVRVDAPSENEIARAIHQSIQSNRRIAIGYANAHTLNQCWDYPLLRADLNAFQMVTCDGFGVRLLGFLLGVTLANRTTMPDWADALGGEWAERGYKIFWLGGQESIAERASQRFSQKHAGVKIAGVYHGYFGKTGAENERVIAQINASGADILLVCFGSPIQERWVIENRNALQVNVIATGGAYFDFLAEALPRAPRWVTDNGLEWLSRLLTHPRHVWKRYIIGLPQILIRTLAHRWGWAKPKA